MLSFGSLLIITYITYSHLCTDRLMGTLAYVKLALSGLMTLCQILSCSREGLCAVADRHNKLLQQLQSCLPVIFLSLLQQEVQHQTQKMLDSLQEGDTTSDLLDLMWVLWYLAFSSFFFNLGCRRIASMRKNLEKLVTFQSCRDNLKSKKPIEDNNKTNKNNSLN